MIHRLFLIVSILVCLVTIPVYANEGIQITYNERVQSGDVVIVNIALDKPSQDFYAIATLHEKAIADTLLEIEFYKVNSQVYSVIIPFSAWYEGGNFYINLEYSSNNTTINKVLPISFSKKDFIEETIYLDARNTAVKTDNSTQRAVQIDVLNELLGTTNEEGIYHTGTFLHPVKNVYYTSYFGDKRNYEYADGGSSVGMHYGLDYRAPIGTPIFACGDGKVVMATMRNSSGNSVVIEHLPGFYSLYYHLDSMSVEVGQMIKQGEQLGEAGKTGLATGPHLHWEIRVQSRPVDPAFFLTNPLVGAPQD